MNFFYQCWQESGKEKQDKAGNCLTEEKAVLSRWMKYCEELYNLEAEGDCVVTEFPPSSDWDSCWILDGEVKAVIEASTNSNPEGVDNTPAELVQVKGEVRIGVLTVICSRIKKKQVKGLSHRQWLLHSDRKEIYSSARFIDPSFCYSSRILEDKP